QRLSTLPRSCCSQRAKKSLNGVATLSAVTTGLPLERGEGRISMKTLSPVEFGLVCVPWKWIFAVLEPWKQSGYVSLPPPALFGYPLLLSSHPDPVLVSPRSMESPKSAGLI